MIKYNTLGVACTPYLSCVFYAIMIFIGLITFNNENILEGFCLYFMVVFFGLHILAFGNAILFLIKIPKESPVLRLKYIAIIKSAQCLGIYGYFAMAMVLIIMVFTFVAGLALLAVLAIVALVNATMGTLAISHSPISKGGKIVCGVFQFVPVLCVVFSVVAYVLAKKRTK